MASGPVSFIRVFDAATETIKQGGVRRGANMAVLRVDHPDILDFVDAKRGAGLGNFNVSVAVTDAFMEAAAAGRSWPLRHPRTGAVVREVPARDLFRRIAEDAWASGEPGLVFLDRVERGQPHARPGRDSRRQPLRRAAAAPLRGLHARARSTWPASERDGKVDWERLAACVRDGVRFLDDVLDVNVWPLPQIAAVSRAEPQDRARA